MTRQRRRASDRLSAPSSRPLSGAAKLGLVLVAGAIVGLLWLVWSAPDLFGPNLNQGPVWADSRSLIYSAQQDNGAGDLFRVDVDGGSPRPLTTTPADERAPAVSRDGRWLAFERQLDGRSDIYVMRLDVPEERRLTTDAAQDLSPTWSPNGRDVAFVSDRAADGVFDVYLVGADGTNLRRLTTDGGYGAPVYSADGQQIALEHLGAIKLLDLRDLVVRPILAGRTGRHPTWSPDRRIAFASPEDGRDALFVMNADGSNVQLVVSTLSGQASAPSWSPDGARIAFVQAAVTAEAPPPTRRRAEGAIYVAELETGQLTRITP